MSAEQTGNARGILFSDRNFDCAAGAVLGYYAGGRSLLWAVVGGFVGLKAGEWIDGGAPKEHLAGLKSTTIATSYGTEAIRKVTNLPVVTQPKPVLMTPSAARGKQVFLKPPVFVGRSKGK